jgi:formylglycine-generating enzyme required for sulfatase activity
MGLNPSYFQGNADSSKRPVEMVSWFDCLAFCNALSTKLGLPPHYELIAVKYRGKRIKEASVSVLGGNGFRLPTVYEWELFAKANTNNIWSGTSIEAELGDYAWYQKNSRDETHPVAQKKPNKWGMYDMTGNVIEWCWNKYDNNDSSLSADRVTRGGGFFSSSSFSRSTYRDNNLPNYYGNDLGFRFCRSLD